MKLALENFAQSRVCSHLRDLYFFHSWLLQTAGTKGTQAVCGDGEYVIDAAGLSTTLSRKSNLLNRFFYHQQPLIPLSLHPDPSTPSSLYPSHPFIFHVPTVSAHSERGAVRWWPSRREQQVLVHRVCWMRSGLYPRWVQLYEAADRNSHVN